MVEKERQRPSIKNRSSSSGLSQIGRLPLAAKRKARMMTQDRLAKLLCVNQRAVSKIEKRSDMYLSTLRSYVEAMGGNLDVRAAFPDGEVVLEHLADAEEEAREAVYA